MSDNIALARKLTRALKDVGLDVSHGKNDAGIRVRDVEGGSVVVYCMKDHERGYDIEMWRNPLDFRSPAASRRLLRTLAQMFRDAGLAVDVTKG